MKRHIYYFLIVIISCTAINFSERIKYSFRFQDCLTQNEKFKNSKCISIDEPEHFCRRQLSNLQESKMEENLLGIWSNDNLGDFYYQIKKGGEVIMYWVDPSKRIPEFEATEEKLFKNSNIRKGKITISNKSLIFKNMLTEDFSIYKVNEFECRTIFDGHNTLGVLKFGDKIWLQKTLPNIQESVNYKISLDK